MTAIDIIFLILASLLYAVGGIAMKHSKGFQAIIPSILVFFFFCLAVAFQTWAMKKIEMSRAYLFVLGFEGVFAVLAGLLFLGESLTLAKFTGIVLVLAGTAFLR